MATGTAKPARRVRVHLPRGGGRLMRKEAAVRCLLDVARQMRVRISIDGGSIEETLDGFRLTRTR